MKYAWAAFFVLLATPAVAQTNTIYDIQQDTNTVNTDTYTQTNDTVTNNVAGDAVTTTNNGTYSSDGSSMGNGGSNSVSVGGEGSTNSSQSVTVGGDTFRRNTPPAIAPTMISSCGAGLSGGASGPSFGAALGIPFGLKTCQRILLATQMAALDKTASACEVMRQDRRIRKAMEAAGETCAVALAPAPPSYSAPMTDRNGLVTERDAPVTERDTFRIEDVRSYPPADGPIHGERG
ncbi:hypothetical protein [Croceicoccus hydrothermalis]|uniref:hypothetical protein n=1 Tax=Croceicoccus hydrothermalis TaxID=2867964 RepID=UPI001EFA4EB6|nr:hypothetical protein [Croceicoccus hydrothermalis]